MANFKEQIEVYTFRSGKKVSNMGIFCLNVRILVIMARFSKDMFVQDKGSVHMWHFQVEIGSLWDHECKA